MHADSEQLEITSQESCSFREHPELIMSMHKGEMLFYETDGLTVQDNTLEAE